MKLKTKGIVRELMADPQTECDARGCKHLWKVKLVRNATRLYLCASHAMHVIAHTDPLPNSRHMNPNVLNSLLN